MHSQTTAVKLTLAVLAISGMFLATRAFGADITGQVMGGGAPIAQSTVTLWAASSDAPKQLAQPRTDNEGRFRVSIAGAPADSSLYLAAGGGISARDKVGSNNPAVALLAVVGDIGLAVEILRSCSTSKAGQLAVLSVAGRCSRACFLN